MAQRMVIALGGNALGKNLNEQFLAARATAEVIAELIAQGHAEIGRAHV